MFDSADVRQERFWRVGIARNGVFFRSFVALKARKGRSEKRGGAKHHACAPERFGRQNR